MAKANTAVVRLSVNSCQRVYGKIERRWMGREEPPRQPRQLPQRKGCHGHNGPVETSNHKSLIEVIAVSPTAMALVPTAVCLLLVTLRLPRDADARSPRGMIHENAKAKNKKKREPTRLVLWKAQINTCKCKHFLSVVSKLNY